MNPKQVLHSKKNNFMLQGGSQMSFTQSLVNPYTTMRMVKNSVIRPVTSTENTEAHQSKFKSAVRTELYHPGHGDLREAVELKHNKSVEEIKHSIGKISQLGSKQDLHFAKQAKTQTRVDKSFSVHHSGSKTKSLLHNASSGTKNPSLLAFN
jgi:hypothetical protein